MLIDYPSGVKGNKLWYTDETGSKSFISRDVIFREDQMYMVKPLTKIGDSVEKQQVQVLSSRNESEVGYNVDIPDMEEQVDNEVVRLQELQRY